MDDAEFKDPMEADLEAALPDPDELDEEIDLEAIGKKKKDLIDDDDTVSLEDEADKEDEEDEEDSFDDENNY